MVTRLKERIRQLVEAESSVASGRQSLVEWYHYKSREFDFRRRGKDLPVDGVEDFYYDLKKKFRGDMVVTNHRGYRYEETPEPVMLNDDLTNVEFEFGTKGDDKGVLLRMKLEELDGFGNPKGSPGSIRTYELWVVNDGRELVYRQTH